MPFYKIDVTLTTLDRHQMSCTIPVPTFYLDAVSPNDAALRALMIAVCRRPSVDAVLTILDEMHDVVDDYCDQPVHAWTCKRSTDGEGFMLGNLEIVKVRKD